MKSKDDKSEDGSDQERKFAFEYFLGAFIGLYTTKWC